MSDEFVKVHDEQIADPEEARKKHLEEIKKYNEEQSLKAQALEEEKKRQFLEFQENQRKEQEALKKKAIETYIPDEFAIHKAENGWVMHHVRKERDGEYTLPPKHEVFLTAEALLERMTEVLKNQIKLDNENE